jgi:hypothetical protein
MYNERIKISTITVTKGLSLRLSNDFSGILYEKYIN